MANINNERDNFGSKLGVILATAGSAVGLGNVWRFPYMAGENGGAVFIIIYVLCVLLLGIPCMVSEFIVGRHGHANTARAYRKLSNGTPWTLIGYMGVLTGFLITGYYAVVSGWCLQYVWASLIGHLHGDPEYFKTYFTALSSDPVKPVVWTVVILGITYLIIEHGVRDGIERASKLLMPTLFFLLLIIVAASCMLPGAEKGIEFLFKPDYSKITSDVFLGALGQSFYSLSIAMGCLCTYASYFQSDTNLTKTAINVATIDTLVAILAGLIIFPAAFSVGIQPDAGPSLVFITLPNVLTRAFAGLPWLTYILSTAFYLLLALAALTSTISMHEVVTVYLHEEFKMSRRKAAWLVTLVCGFIGIICALSLGIGKEYTLFGMTLFDIFDFVTAKLMLPIGGFFISIFTGWYLDKKILHDELNSGGHLPIYLYKAIVFILRFIAPIGIGFVFINELGVL